MDRYLEKPLRNDAPATVIAAILDQKRPESNAPSPTLRSHDAATPVPAADEAP